MNIAEPALKQRTILVTGCSSGIGAYCADALRKDGWRVFVTARKSDDIARLQADGFECFYLDYADGNSIEACFADVMAATGGRLDALFNNGGYSQVGAVEDMPDEALRAQFDANFFGYHHLTRLVVPVMRGQGHGRIVHNSSVFGIVPGVFRGAYVASKHALEGLMLSLRLELTGSNVFVVMIEPGAIESKIVDNALPLFERHIDIEGSLHKADYQNQLQRLKRTGVPTGKAKQKKLGPQGVYHVLKKALNATNPKAHYPVTWLTKVLFVLKRVLPTRLFYAVLEKGR